VLRTKQSTFAQLQQSAPEVVAKLNVAASRLNDLLSDDNRRAIAHVLANLDETTQAVARRSADIDATIANANKAMANLSDASNNLRPTLSHVDLTIQKYGKVADDADAFINGDGLAQLSDLIGEMRRLVANLTQFSDQLNRTPTKLLFGDRRKGNDNRTNSAPMFEPPNSLKMKARDKLTSDAVTRQLEGDLRAAREMLTAEKLRRDAFQVCILWRLMQEAARVAGQELPDIIKLQLLTKSIAQRSLESEFHEAVDWCQQVQAAAEGLLLDVDRNASMHLLGHAALSLHQVFHPEKGTGEQLSEIDATVTLIRARNMVASMAAAG
jgi:hypothetical protein